MRQDFEVIGARKVAHLARVHDEFARGDVERIGDITLEDIGTNEPRDIEIHFTMGAGDEVIRHMMRLVEDVRGQVLRSETEFCEQMLPRDGLHGRCCQHRAIRS
jgi:hypothetical protein